MKPQKFMHKMLNIFSLVDFEITQNENKFIVYTFPSALNLLL